VHRAYSHSLLFVIHNMTTTTKKQNSLGERERKINKKSGVIIAYAYIQIQIKQKNETIVKIQTKNEFRETNLSDKHDCYDSRPSR